MRGNERNFGQLNAPLKWQEAVWENSWGGGWYWVWTVAADEHVKAQIRDEQ